MVEQFLDEIVESLTLQQNYFVLQYRSFTRMGGVSPIKVDMRIIAATNRNLEAMVKQDKFRKICFIV